MKVKIVFDPGFRTDLYAQIDRLVAEGNEDWAQRLLEEIETAARLLSSSPLTGPIDLQRDGHEIRRLVLRRLPIVIWYSFQRRRRIVVVLRLFHTRQERK
ncbi:MAG TPA: type II toxin-antitoxin system RelE/ParE family toxin [Myxococcales bacterium]|jgi:plasmid stabilization system protein ParE|nr:type II toxin-antitoxin system RelE/ParE family toxin [Myxococcales bacterium]